MKSKKNNRVEELITALKTLSIEKKVPLWKRLALELERPTRSKREVNIYKIDSTAKDGEIIVVPGKVLGSGELTKKVTVAALQFSTGAQEKIKAQQGELLSITELMEKNPQGKKVRVMG